MRFPLLIALLLLFLASCQKDNPDPALTAISWTAENISRYQSELLGTLNFPGDLYLGDKAGADLSAFRNIETIAGDLIIINTEATDLTDFASLQRVQNLTLRFNQAATRVEFPALRSIDSLRIFTHPQLVEVDFPQLEKVDYATVYDNAELTKVRLPQIQDFSVLSIWRNNSFTELICCEQLTALDPSAEQDYRRVALEFSRIASPASLFRDNPTPLYLTLKFHDPDQNDFRWLRNLDLDTSDEVASWLELSCQAPYEELCFLTELLNLEDYANIWFDPYENELVASRSVRDLIDFCE